MASSLPHTAMKTYLRALRYLWPYRWRVALGLGCLLLSTPLTLVHPWIWGFIVDRVVLPRRLEGLVPALTVMTGAHLAGSLLRAWQQNLLGTVGRRFVQDVRNAVHDKLQSQSLEYLQARPAGDLVLRAVGDVDLLQSMVLGVTEGALSNLYAAVVAVCAIAALQPLLALITVPPMLAVWFFTHRYNRQVLQLYRASRAALGVVNTQLQEMLAGIMVTKVFVKEAEQAAAFREKTAGLRQEETRAIRAQTAFFAGVESIAFLGNALAVGVAAVLIVQGRFSLGGLVAYRAYSARIMDPVFQLAQLSDQIQRGVAAGERVFELLDAADTLPDPPDAPRLEAVEGRVRWENVTFGYSEREVLRGVDLEIAPGETVAVVGGSGAGKSTLLHLIPRLWDPRGGRVTVDGLDVRLLDQRSLRRHVAVVQQDAFLFSGTVLENIRFAQKHASLEEVRAAAAAANALHFIERELAAGWDTEVGERGVKLSGGQRQRVCIARAFLADPRILILDEPTSAVEPESEGIIQQALENLARDRTTFIITHRMALTRAAHRVVVLAEGRVAECGPPGELLRQGGLYAAMCERAGEPNQERLANATTGVDCR